MVKIKLVNGSDIRVFHSPNESKSKKYAALQEFIAARFSLAQGDYSLYYVDDEGDNVTLASEKELEDAVSIAQEDNRKSLKIFINHMFVAAAIEAEEPVISSTIDDDDAKNDEIGAKTQSKNSPNSNSNIQDAAPEICGMVRDLLPAEVELVDAYWAPGSAGVTVDVLPPFDSPHGWRGHDHINGPRHERHPHGHPPHWHRHRHGGKRHGKKFGKRCGGKWFHHGHPLGRQGEHGHGHRFQINATMHPLAGTNSQLMASVVKSISLKDGTCYPLDTVLSKVWRIKNIGCVEWGDNVQLVFLEGEESMLVERRFPVPNLKPGQKGVVTAMIRTPSKSGRYQIYFKLQRSGDFFGPKLWADICAVDENGVDATMLNKKCKRKGKQYMNKNEVRQMRLAKMEAKLENRQMKLQAKNMKLVNNFEDLSIHAQEMSDKKSNKQASKFEKKSNKLSSQMSKVQQKLDKLEEKKLAVASKMSNSNSNSNNDASDYEATVVIMAENEKDDIEGSNEDFMIIADEQNDDVPDERVVRKDLVQPASVAEPEEQVSGEVNEAQNGDFMYAAELRQLAAMGFPTGDATRALLVRHKGNLNQVLQELF